YHPLEGVAQDVDVGFVGSPYRNRIQTIERLLRDFPERSFCVYGRYTRYTEPKTWSRFLSIQLDPRRRKVYANRVITPLEINRLYARSKIALNIHRKGAQYGCNPRVFEIMGSGAFQITDANGYIEEHLSGVVCLYNDYTELRSLVAKYL